MRDSGRNEQPSSKLTDNGTAEISPLRAHIIICGVAFSRSAVFGWMGSGPGGARLGGAGEIDTDVVAYRRGAKRVLAGPTAATI